MIHPFLAPEFQVRWSTLVPEAIEPDVREALAQAKANIEAICSQDPTSANYESAFLAYENAAAPLNLCWERIAHLDSVSDHPAQREAYGKMLPEMTEFTASLPLNERLWTVIRSARANSETAALSPVQKRLIEETLANFRENGADLPPEKKHRFAAIAAELAQLTKKFSEQVLDSTNAWQLLITDKGRLAGLPDSAIAGAAANAQAKGFENTWRFTLQPTSWLPVMQHLDDESLRKEIWEALSRIASEGASDNTSLVWRILELRQEKAELLGHPHFADLNLLRRMAKNGASALAFIDLLHARILPTFLADAARLVQYKATKSGLASGPLEPWEVSYWAEKQRLENYDFDEELLRPYFPMENVMKGMYEIASRLFGITIHERDTIFIDPSNPPSLPPDSRLVETWHAECKFYEVYDSNTHAHLGSFYADWHPRDSKRGGAWMNPLHIGVPGVPHLALMIGNMSPPLNGQQAQFTHDEVLTIFHEFGHLLHVLLSEVPVRSLAATNVPTDFVEFPSQIMENYCWDRESLDLFARHVETAAVIPEELFAKMVAARNYRSAAGLMGQLAHSKIDLEIHTRLGDFLGKDLDVLEREVLGDYLVPLKTQSRSRLPKFNHLFSDPVGYAAGYYSYKWSEVLDADAFSRFQQEGILNPATGADLRKHVLSMGNSVPSDELYRRFMGRDPELEPILIRAGLATTQ